MIVQLILICLSIANLAFAEALIYEGKRWKSFPWDEHLFFNVQRGIMFASVVWASTQTLQAVIICLITALFAFMFIHNGTFYETRKRIDISNGDKIDYPKGFFDMTKTPYKLFGAIRLSFSFPVRLILFLVGIGLFVALLTTQFKWLFSVF